MEKNDFYSQFARKSTGYKLAVLGMVLGLLALLYWQFRLSGLWEQRDNLQRQKAGSIAKQESLDKDLLEQRKLLKQQEELKALIAANEKALPTEAELPTFFKHLQRKAGDAGVNIQRWDRKKEEPVGAYIRVPVDIELTGTYHNIMRYFALLGPDDTFAEAQRRASSRPVLPPVTPPANPPTADGDASDGGGADGGGAAGASDDLVAGGEDAQINKRIVSIENLQLQDAKVKDGAVVLTAKFTASTFRQETEVKDAKGKDAKAKPRGNNKGGAAK